MTDKELAEKYEEKIDYIEVNDDGKRIFDLEIQTCCSLISFIIYSLIFVLILRFLFLIVQPALFLH